MTELQNLMNDIREWSDITFPESTALSKAYHLKEEVDELIKEIKAHRDIKDMIHHHNMLKEYADCFILILNAASLSNVSAQLLINISIEKMKENKKRKWGKPDENGVVKHIKERRE